MTSSSLPSSTSAAAAVTAYMVKEDGSMPVEAINMPLLTVRKSRKARATAGEQRRRTALYSMASVAADAAPMASFSM